MTPADERDPADGRDSTHLQFRHARSAAADGDPRNRLHECAQVGQTAILDVHARNRRKTDRCGLHGRFALLSGDDDLFELRRVGPRLLGHDGLTRRPGQREDHSGALDSVGTHATSPIAPPRGLDRV